MSPNRIGRNKEGLNEEIEKVKTDIRMPIAEAPDHHSVRSVYKQCALPNIVCTLSVIIKW